MLVRPVSSAPEITTHLMVCPWSQRRKNPWNRNSICQHQYLRLSPFSRNLKKSRSSTCPKMKRKTLLKKMSRSHHWVDNKCVV